jgi:hypothetical protein
MRQYTAALACLFLGCAAGSAMPTITAQTFGANPSAPRWEQFCDFASADDVGALRFDRQWPEFNEILARRGAEGWELVEIAQVGIYRAPCFKRPAAQ